MRSCRVYIIISSTVGASLKGPVGGPCGCAAPSHRISKTTRDESLKKRGPLLGSLCEGSYYFASLLGAPAFWQPPDWNSKQMNRQTEDHLPGPRAGTPILSDPGSDRLYCPEVSGCSGVSSLFLREGFGSIQGTRGSSFAAGAALFS